MQKQDIYDIFCSVSNRNEMIKLMNELLTKSEISDLTLRWNLLCMLSEGLSQREIASKLGVSLCKITRGAKILKDDKGVVKKIFDQNNKQKA